MGDVVKLPLASPARIALIVQLLSIRADRNTPAQSAELEAAKRLLGVK